MICNIIAKWTVVISGRVFIVWVQIPKCVFNYPKISRFIRVPTFEIVSSQFPWTNCVLALQYISNKPLQVSAQVSASTMFLLILLRMFFSRSWPRKYLVSQTQRPIAVAVGQSLHQLVWNGWNKDTIAANVTRQAMSQSLRRRKGKIPGIGGDTVDGSEIRRSPGRGHSLSRYLRRVLAVGNGISSINSTKTSKKTYWHMSCCEYCWACQKQFYQLLLSSRLVRSILHPNQRTTPWKATKNPVTSCPSMLTFCI